MARRVGLTDQDPRSPAVQALLSAAGFDRPSRLLQIAGGANNRVFKVQAASRQALLKLYFTHPGDARNRLDAEFGFCRFAWSRGVRDVPQPLDQSEAAFAAVYEFIEGRRLSAGDVGGTAIAAALRFYDRLNEHRNTDDAERLPEASEARFSLSAHAACVSDRVARLAALPGASDVDAVARAFVRERLAPRWMEIRAPILDRPDADEEVPTGDRRLSPCDFGFHNALETAGERLRFVDFEYAGWDDPARMVSDFFCQPSVPVPDENFELVAVHVANGLSRPAWHMDRMRVLYPVYQIKWCCILLNEFLDVGGDRRQFSSSGDLAGRKAVQLAKAQLALSRLRPAPFMPAGAAGRTP